MTTPDLRAVRLGLGLTLQQLAVRSGIQVGNLSRVERGKEFPRPARAQRLALALNLPVPQVYAAIAAKNASGDPCRASEVGAGAHIQASGVSHGS